MNDLNQEKSTNLLLFKQCLRKGKKKEHLFVFFIHLIEGGHRNQAHIAGPFIKLGWLEFEQYPLSFWERTSKTSFTLPCAKKTTEVFYWRGKAEVDFVVNTASGVTPLQVTFGKPQERHERGLREFYEQFPHAAEAIYVTPDTFEELVELEL